MKQHKILLLVAGCMLPLAACEYNEVVKADYLDQAVYMPAAAGGRYMIDNIALPDKPYRYEIDATGRRFKVALGAYRSGPHNDGAVTVDIAVNNDTVAALISNGGLANARLLPAAEYELPASVKIEDGGEIAIFHLSIDLDYLRAATQQQALCVAISSAQVKPNPMLNKTLVVIDPKMLHPVPGFDVNPNSSDPRTILFTNTSAYALQYRWDFGDGSVTGEASPRHTFAEPGTYRVKLTAVGATGKEDEQALTKEVVIP